MFFDYTMASPDKDDKENVRLLIIGFNDLTDKLNMLAEQVDELSRRLKESEGR
jgi:hypothetical protein